MEQHCCQWLDLLSMSNCCWQHTTPQLLVLIIHEATSLSATVASNKVGSCMAHLRQHTFTIKVKQRTPGLSQHLCHVNIIWYIHAVLYIHVPRGYIYIYSTIHSCYLSYMFVLLQDWTKSWVMCESWWGGTHIIHTVRDSLDRCGTNLVPSTVTGVVTSSPWL